MYRLRDEAIWVSVHQVCSSCSGKGSTAQVQKFWWKWKFVDYLQEHDFAQIHWKCTEEFCLQMKKLILWFMHIWSQFIRSSVKQSTFVCYSNLSWRSRSTITTLPKSGIKAVSFCILLHSCLLTQHSFVWLDFYFGIHINLWLVPMISIPILGSSSGSYEPGCYSSL